MLLSNRLISTKKPIRNPIGENIFAEEWFEGNMKHSSVQHFRSLSGIEAVCFREERNWHVTRKGSQPLKIIQKGVPREEKRETHRQFIKQKKNKKRSRSENDYSTGK